MAVNSSGRSIIIYTIWSYNSWLSDVCCRLKKNYEESNAVTRYLAQAIFQLMHFLVLLFFAFIFLDCMQLLCALSLAGLVWKCCDIENQGEYARRGEAVWEDGPRWASKRPTIASTAPFCIRSRSSRSARPTRARRSSARRSLFHAAMTKTHLPRRRSTNLTQGCDEIPFLFH